MLYTGKGDNGDTDYPGAPTRVSKTDPVVEALGAIDELNAWIGYCRVKAAQDVQKLPVTHYPATAGPRLGGGQLPITRALHDVQQDLFIIQAELVGMKKIEEGRVRFLESIIAGMEKELPPIETFLLAGGTELGALLDIARTVCRRAERAAVHLSERSPLNPYLLAYLNRLSSLLYAAERLTNHRAGVTEEAPTYGQ